MILYLGNFILEPEINPTFSFALAEKLKTIYPIKTAGTALNRWHRLAQMLKALLVQRPRVLLLDGYATRAFWYLVVLSWVARVRGIPYILLLHSGAWPRRWHTHAKWAKPLFSGAQQIICTSAFLLHPLPWNKDRAKVIHNFGLSRMPGAKRETYQHKLLWVREYQARYGDEEVLILGNLLHVRGAKSSITMVGPKVESIKSRWAHTGLPWPENVTLKGQMAPEEWQSLAWEHSVFLNTSKEDSFPVSLIEALACGMPVLTTAVGGIPEMIEEGRNGWLVPVGDLASMADIVVALETNPTGLPGMSEYAMESAQAFSWDHLEPKWREVFDPFY